MLRHRERFMLPAWSLLLLLRITPVLAQIDGDPADAVRFAQVGPWKPLFVGVEVCEASTERPRPLQVRAVRVDLKEPTISILVTPSNGDEPLDTGARKTSEFLEDFKCQVAINGSPFKPFAGRRGQPQDVLGLSLSRGDLYSPPDNNYDALLIDGQHRARIARKPIRAGNAVHGIGGFYALLLDGRNNGGMKDLHPRTAVGVSEEGRYLILMVVDGRQQGYSEGTTTAETAEWMRRLGAHNALNLDGGGSTTLVIEGPEGKPKVLNRPSGQFQRRVANHLGVFARPLQEPPSTQPATAPMAATQPAS